MNKNKYQLNYSDIAKDVYDFELRINKAKKTISILEDYLGSLKSFNLLDIGCSSGIMTNIYSDYFYKVTGIDIDSKAISFALQNNNKKNISFLICPIEENKFQGESFDVITCSHIYEHIPDDEKLMEEIYRLLKPGGVCYFVAGNRFKIIEPHYSLPFLSFFPKNISNIYLRIFKKENYYYENLKSYRNLVKLVKKFEIEDYTLKVIKNPTFFYNNDLILEGSFRYYIFNSLAKLFYFAIPTYIWVLKKPID